MTLSVFWKWTRHICAIRFYYWFFTLLSLYRFSRNWFYLQEFKLTVKRAMNNCCIEFQGNGSAQLCNINCVKRKKLKWVWSSTGMFPISFRACFFGPQSSFISEGFSIRVFWNSIASWEAKTLLFSISFITAPLLLHLEAAQPQEVPQLPPAARHPHLEVLHKDFLLQEQHTPDTGFGAITPSEDSKWEVSVSNISIPLPVEAEDCTWLSQIT